MSLPGYSGKPLVEKLGLKPGMVAIALDATDEYDSILGSEIPFSSSIGSESPDFVHVFVTERARLEFHLRDLYSKIHPDGRLWVSWPKKASKVHTDITEDVIREICLPMGWVDIKVCAVTDVWSGLKLVIRKELRQP